MCAVPLVQLVHHKNSEIAVAEAEDAGSTRCAPPLQLQHALQAHRGLANRVLRGDATRPPTASARARRGEHADRTLEAARPDGGLG
jgi:hypothetical protein